MIFRAKYFYLTILIFVIEVEIALFINDQFIRPFVGDILVVILIYCFLRSFWRLRPNGAIASVFCFACGVEMLQYFNIVTRLGLQNHRVLAVVIGTVFDWKDILAYGMGCAIIFGLENRGSFAAVK